MSEAFERILPYALAFSEGIDRCRNATTLFNAVENGDNWTCTVSSDSYCRKGPFAYADKPIDVQEDKTVSMTIRHSRLSNSFP